MSAGAAAGRPDGAESTGGTASAGGTAGRTELLERIRDGLRVADEILADFTPGRIDAERKKGGDPVTAADLAVDKALRERLPRDGEGWLSEETARSPARLKCRRVWIVDPIDGTKEFVRGIPEWCVSIGYVEDGEAIAGGIYNRAANHQVVGAVDVGVWLNEEPVSTSATADLAGSVVLASRSEIGRGEWQRFLDTELDVRPTGSVAYKLGLVAAGMADATWTLVPKSEWDVAAGVALVHAAGGSARTLDGRAPRFNREPPLLEGLVACNGLLTSAYAKLLGLPLP